jgi:hypothetical protein
MRRASCARPAWKPAKESFASELAVGACVLKVLFVGLELVRPSASGAAAGKVSVVAVVLDIVAAIVLEAVAVKPDFDVLLTCFFFFFPAPISVPSFIPQTNVGWVALLARLSVAGTTLGGGIKHGGVTKLGGTQLGALLFENKALATFGVSPMENFMVEFTSKMNGFAFSVVESGWIPAAVAGSDIRKLSNSLENMSGCRCCEPR